jgi:hypothetical protein
MGKTRPLLEIAISTGQVAPEAREEIRFLENE